MLKLHAGDPPMVATRAQSCRHFYIAGAGMVIMTVIIGWQVVRPLCTQRFTELVRAAVAAADAVVHPVRRRRRGAPKASISASTSCAI